MNVNIKPPRAFLLYLAGFWDGEGSFGVSSHTVRRPYGNYPSFQHFAVVTNTDKPVLEYIQKMLDAGALISLKAYLSQQNPKWREAWKLQFSSREGRQLAALLLPHLRIKSEQAKILIDWPHKKAGGQSRDLVTHEKQRLLYEQMKALNHRGP